MKISNIQLKEIQEIGRKFTFFAREQSNTDIPYFWAGIPYIQIVMQIFQNSSIDFNQNWSREQKLI